MESITYTIDTDTVIFLLTDYNDLLNLKEVNKYCYEVISHNNFWKNYLYTQLLLHHINPTHLEHYRPQLEPY